jgi:hypothetical protein
VDALLAGQAAEAAQQNQTSIQLGPGHVEDLAQSISEGKYVFSNIDKLSMANIAPGSPRLWAHLVSVYVVTLITLRVSLPVCCSCCGKTCSCRQSILAEEDLQSLSFLKHMAA